MLYLRLSAVRTKGDGLAFLLVFAGMKKCQLRESAGMNGFAGNETGGDVPRLLRITIQESAADAEPWLFSFGAEPQELQYDEEQPAVDESPDTPQENAHLR